ncbi:uncharacterized protein LOC124450944 [Xenia sp. Carnegie-2017]|uniref:uncharacterized protein LOC124450944 n=1 Tax=Xenia sp. Carnegie-2017 TaxID=2897299 RepID=UPI001F03CDD7|nr:uncharacterized protein LOC124450944 [Xenia sp. Carnegie-2017]
MSTSQQMKEMCFYGEGGLCYVIAYFCWMLFGALGFSVRLISSTVTSTKSYMDNHAIVLIHGLVYETDIHLVDCGSGYPTFRAVSLNFSNESPVFKDGFLEYKFIRHDGKILRMHGKGDRLIRNDPPIEAIWFPRKRAVMIIKNKLMLENEKGQLVTTILANDEEVIKAYNKYFSIFKEEKIKRALEEWHEVSGNSR